MKRKVRAPAIEESEIFFFCFKRKEKEEESLCSGVYIKCISVWAR